MAAMARVAGDVVRERNVLCVARLRQRNRTSKYSLKYSVEPDITGRFSRVIIPSQSRMSVAIDKPLEATFAAVCSAQASQREVFDMLLSGPTDRFLRGQDVSVLPIGGTDAGKSYSLLGDDELAKQGVIPRCIQRVCDMMEVDSDKYQSQTLQLGYLLCRDDVGYDILDGSLATMPQDDWTHVVQASDVPLHTVKDLDEARDMISTASVNMMLNDDPEQKTVSHTVCILRLSRHSIDAPEPKVSIMRFFDLSTASVATGSGASGASFSACLYLAAKLCARDFDTSLIDQLIHAGISADHSNLVVLACLHLITKHTSSIESVLKLLPAFQQLEVRDEQTIHVEPSKTAFGDSGSDSHGNSGAEDDQDGIDRSYGTDSKANGTLSGPTSTSRSAAFNTGLPHSDESGADTTSDEETIDDDSDDDDDDDDDDMDVDDDNDKIAIASRSNKNARPYMDRIPVDSDEEREHEAAYNASLIDDYEDQISRLKSVQTDLESKLKYAIESAMENGNELQSLRQENAQLARAAAASGRNDSTTNNGDDSKHNDGDDANDDAKSTASNSSVSHKRGSGPRRRGRKHQRSQMENIIKFYLEDDDKDAFLPVDTSNEEDVQYVFAQLKAQLNKQKQYREVALRASQDVKRLEKELEEKAQTIELMEMRRKEAEARAAESEYGDDGGDDKKRTDDEQFVENFCEALRQGAEVLKYGRSGSPHKRLFRLLGNRLIWNKGKKFIMLDAIEGVFVGRKSPPLQKQALPEHEYRCLVVYTGAYSLSLQFDSEDDMKKWHRALHLLVPRLQYVEPDFLSK
jgi:Kinesin motor domain